MDVTGRTSDGGSVRALSPTQDVPSFLVGLIGSGIGPSLTPAMHETEAAELGRRLVYRRIDLDAWDLPASSVGELVRSAPRYGFDGLNITHPCKQLVLPHLDELTPDAAALGAVNTVVFDGERAVGHNTDWSAFARSLELGLPTVPRERVVLLGAGGAGAAVAHALMTAGVRDLSVVDTDQDRASGLVRDLAERFPGHRCEAAPPSEVGGLLTRADGLVNATPAGMAQHPAPPVSPELLRPHLWVADVVYRPLRTALLAEAEGIGCATLDGGGMAVFQAAQALELITGMVPDHDRMMAHFAAVARG
ncbi:MULTISPECIES: shikimate dehydrogenase [Nocardiopsis]|uniref:shikimate dehydrogenase n=1 Tax=Nocardiopsis TaxID=2013 RepID=UPI000371B7C3